MRVKLIVAYDGTNYHGYQSQTNGVAVQDVLEDAIEHLFGERIRTMGPAGRTRGSMPSAMSRVLTWSRGSIRRRSHLL